MSIFKCPVCDGASWAPIIVDSPEDATEESLGSKEKFWLENKQLLFKFARDDPPGDVRGEDWAECVVHAVARALAIPSACVALGRCRNQRGVVVKTVLGPAETLKHGNEIMEEFLKDFDANLERANPQYTVDNVAAALHSYDASPTLPEWNALDQFMAYLVLDALVAGTDRHLQNWGIIVRTEGTPTMAPTFDHGNALGFSEPPHRIAQLLSDLRVASSWVKKGGNRYFNGKPRLVDLAREAYFHASGLAQDAIVDRLKAMDLHSIANTMSGVPADVMSDEQRMFARVVLELNQRRLLDALST